MHLYIQLIWLLSWTLPLTGATYELHTVEHFSGMDTDFKQPLSQAGHFNYGSLRGSWAIFRHLCFPEILVLPLNSLYRVSVHHLTEGQLRSHGDVQYFLLSALAQQLLLYLTVLPNKQKLPSSFSLLSCNLFGFIHWLFSFCNYRSSRNWILLF